MLAETSKRRSSRVNTVSHLIAAPGVAIQPAGTRLPVSAVIFTKNAADRIGRCLASLVYLCEGRNLR